MTVLMYHDVVTKSDTLKSGFPGADANHYKIAPDDFSLHLRILRRYAPEAVLTFDDGGISALEPTCELLEEHGFHGHFFVPTAFIGTTGFCSSTELRAIAARGHSIGSHSHTHPIPISALSPDDLWKEWSTSRTILEDVLGGPVIHASVPGGFSTPRVIASALEAGYQEIFTSVPTRRTVIKGTARIVGRFGVTRSTSRSKIEQIARGHSLPWWRANLEWKLKHVLKSVGGPMWFRLRQVSFEHRKT